MAGFLGPLLLVLRLSIRIRLPSETVHLIKTLHVAGILLLGLLRVGLVPLLLLLLT